MVFTVLKSILRICRDSARANSFVFVSRRRFAEKEVLNVTANQINYQKLREDQRHNRAVESETGRHNVQQEAIGFATVGESQRHNQATEAVNWYTQNWMKENAANQLAETTRHNIEGESLRGDEIVMSGGKILGDLGTSILRLFAS